MKERILKEQTDIFGNAIKEGEAIRGLFIEPPFSVLDTKTGNWQKRKKAWGQLGIKSELGRDVVTFANSFANEKYGRTEKDALPKESIFDPALCELMYNWFCPSGGRILDPFAGGSVRGIVANYLGFQYEGIDIRPEQIESNREQALTILKADRQPLWHIGDSNLVLDNITTQTDLVLSCPPYADLEVYSDLEGDISNMDYYDFTKFHRSIIKKACDKLVPNGFAVWVIGDVRDKKTGEYYNFVSDTIQAFKDAGMMYWNEIILLNAVGTAMLRANNTFEKGGRKVVKIHQNVLVFKKPENQFILQ